jgi:hypothetical protein
VTLPTDSGRRNQHAYFKLMRNRATNTIKYSKRRFMMSYLDINQPPKRLWRQITDLGLTKASPFIGDVDVNGLNEFFNASGTECWRRWVFCPISRFYSFFVQQEVAEAAFSIKSEAIGLDNVYLKFVKLLAPSLIPRITNFFNFRSTRDIFPAAFNVSKIIPLLIISNPIDFSDYCLLLFCHVYRKLLRCACVVRWWNI